MLVMPPEANRWPRRGIPAAGWCCSQWHHGGHACPPSHPRPRRTAGPGRLARRPRRDPAHGAGTAVRYTLEELGAARTGPQRRGAGAAVRRGAVRRGAAAHPRHAAQRGRVRRRDLAASSRPARRAGPAPRPRASAGERPAGRPRRPAPSSAATRHPATTGPTSRASSPTIRGEHAARHHHRARAALARGGAAVAASRGARVRPRLDLRPPRVGRPARLARVRHAPTLTAGVDGDSSDPARARSSRHRTTATRTFLP